MTGSSRMTCRWHQPLIQEPWSGSLQKSEGFVQAKDYRNSPSTMSQQTPDSSQDELEAMMNDPDMISIRDQLSPYLRNPYLENPQNPLPQPQLPSSGRWQKLRLTLAQGLRKMADRLSSNTN